jgi:hypothetical protein
MMFISGTVGGLQMRPWCYKKKFLILHKPFMIEGLTENVVEYLAKLHVISASLRTARKWTDLDGFVALRPSEVV